MVLERITSLTRRSSRAGAMPSSANRGAEMYGLTFDKVPPTQPFPPLPDLPAAPPSHSLCLVPRLHAATGWPCRLCLGGKYAGEGAGLRPGEREEGEGGAGEEIPNR